MQRNQIHPQDCTDTIRDDYDLLSKEDTNLFILKIDALNAHLDSLYGKSDHGEVKQSRETDESSKDHILLNNHRRVVRDINLDLQ